MDNDRDRWLTRDLFTNNLLQEQILVSLRDQHFRQYLECSQLDHRNDSRVLDDVKATPNPQRRKGEGDADGA